MTDQKVLSIRIPKDILDKLKKTAKTEHRSCSQQAVLYIEKQLTKKLVGKEHDNQ